MVIYSQVSRKSSTAVRGGLSRRDREGAELRAYREGGGETEDCKRKTIESHGRGNGDDLRKYIRLKRAQEHLGS